MGSRPIYFSTGSKWRAFFWGTMSGLAEVFAGGVGWIAFASSGSDLGSLAYGQYFTVVHSIFTVNSQCIHRLYCYPCLAPWPKGDHL